MAINLNPGADATLVQAAYAASMANVPKDLSPIYKQMGDSYQLAMQSFGESFGGAMEKIGEVAGIAVQQAIKGANFRARGNYIQSQYGSTFFTDRLNEIKQGMKDVAYGITLDPEKRGKYLALKDEKDRLFTQIELLGNADMFSDDLLINGNYSQGGTGTANMIFKTALQNQGDPINNHDNPKYNGYRVGIDTRDNGDLFFTLLNKDGVAVTHEDADGNLMTDGDKPMTVDINNINNVVVGENLSAKTALNKLFADEITNGKQAKTKYRGTRFNNAVKSIIKDDATLRYLMFEDDLAANSLGQSFAKDLNSPSTFSKDIWSMLAMKAGLEIGEDIKDVDTSGGISPGDFATGDNYKIVKNALLNRTSDHYKFENSKDAFVAWAGRAGSDQFLYGTTLRSGSNDDGGGDSIYKTTGSYLIDGSYRKVEDINPTINAINSGKDYKSSLIPWNNEYKFSRRKNGKYQLLPTGGGEDDWVTFDSGIAMGAEIGLTKNMFDATAGGNNSGGGGSGGNPFTGDSAPKTFRNAVDEDDVDVIDYLEEMNIPGLEMERTTGNDAFRLRYAGGKWKKFQADPNFGNTTKRANAIWKWLKNNYKPPL